jgi:hypothetical protein
VLQSSICVDGLTDSPRSQNGPFTNNTSGATPITV